MPDFTLKLRRYLPESGDAPKITYSPVTMTQWEPQERKY